MFEVYTTKDQTVSKYIHDDGSETAIKTISTCNQIYNPLTKEMEQLEDRNKYVVFISSSVGCPVGCKFCYLTVKKYPFYPITINKIVQNVKEAINHKLQINPELKEKHIKLSFMGMGDPIFIVEELPTISHEILKWVKKNKYAAGVDGIDIGTVFPKFSSYIKYCLEFTVENLITIVSNFKRNPLSNSKNGVRLFYSLHSFNKDIRNKLIPLKDDPIRISEFLINLKNIDIIYHNIFFNGINDSLEQVKNFVGVYNKLNEFNELRILKFNKCKNSTLCSVNDDHFNNTILLYLNENIKKLKIQFSAGSEIKASCGQFLMKKFITK